MMISVPPEMIAVGIVVIAVLVLHRTRVVTGTRARSELTVCAWIKGVII